MRFLRFLYDPRGRISRRAMWYYTLASLTTFFLLGRFADSATSVASLAATLGLILSILLIVPAYFAVPLKRFHDMSRSVKTLGAILVAAIVGWVFMVYAATKVPMPADWTVAHLLVDPATPVVDAMNAAQQAGTEFDKNLMSTAYGGLSLFLIAYLILFGWTHFVPGQKTENRFGQMPNPLYTEFPR